MHLLQSSHIPVKTQSSQKYRPFTDANDKGIMVKDSFQPLLQRKMDSYQPVVGMKLQGSTTCGPALQHIPTQWKIPSNEATSTKKK